MFIGHWNLFFLIILFTCFVCSVELFVFFFIISSLISIGWKTALTPEMKASWTVENQSLGESIWKNLIYIPRSLLSCFPGTSPMSFCPGRVIPAARRFRVLLGSGPGRVHEVTWEAHCCSVEAPPLGACHPEDSHSQISTAPRTSSSNDLSHTKLAIQRTTL
jgi:hypothetical protein